LRRDLEQGGGGVVFAALRARRVLTLPGAPFLFRGVMDFKDEERLIRYLTRRYRRQHDYEDLLQECHLHILAGARNYDPKRGAWSTFIGWQCRHAIRTWRNGPHRDPPPAVLSLDVPGTESGAPFVDLLVDPRQAPDLEALDRVEREAVFRSVTNFRRRKALSLRLGGYTLQEIGDRLGVSRERARQLVMKALEEAKEAGAA